MYIKVRSATLYIRDIIAKLKEGIKKKIKMLLCPNSPNVIRYNYILIKRKKMKKWYYKLDDKESEPISKEELLNAIEEGRLTEDVLVRDEDMAIWVEACSINSFFPTKAMKKTEENSRIMRELGYEVSGEQVRPWIRYWARGIDVSLFMILFIIIWIVIAITMDIGGELLDEIPDILFGVIIGFFYVFFEPLLLSTWGTTVGKSLLKVRVLNRDGSKLPYQEGLKRTFSIWFFGQGIGLPLVTIITNIMAYNRLTNDGITSWDKDGEYIVSHQIIGNLRATLLILIPILVIALFFMFLGSIDG